VIGKGHAITEEGVDSEWLGKELRGTITAGWILVLTFNYQLTKLLNYQIARAGLSLEGATLADLAEPYADAL
jgi:hypothetical protein